MGCALGSEVPARASCKEQRLPNPAIRGSIQIEAFGALEIGSPIDICGRRCIRWTQDLGRASEQRSHATDGEISLPA